MPYQPFFVDQVEAGNVREISSRADSIEGELKNEATYNPPGDAKPVGVTKFKTEVPAFIDPSELTRLLDRAERGDQCRSRPTTGRSLWVTLVLGFLPTILLVGVLHLAVPSAERSGWRRGARRLRPLHRAAGHARRAGAGHLRRRRRNRRSRGRARRGRGLPQESEALHEARRAGPARGDAVRAAGDRQDAAGPRRRGRGGRRLLLAVGLGVRRGDRGCGCLARARPVQAGQGGGAGDRLHRRAGRGRPLSVGQRGRDQRWSRRARADAEPDPHGDGRVRARHERDRARRDEPSRGARSGAATPWALRPPYRGPAP